MFFNKGNPTFKPENGRGVFIMKSLGMKLVMNGLSDLFWSMFLLPNTEMFRSSVEEIRRGQGVFCQEFLGNFRRDPRSASMYSAEQWERVNRCHH